jgi:hypothetical protein|tara:strand:- start:1160 stop:1498 length:339 start_codon:yes stop_codon:yes gene_type:complete
MTKNNSSHRGQSILSRAQEALDWLQTDATTIFHDGMAAVNWLKFEDHISEAVDVVNLLDEWVPKAEKSRSSLQDFLTQFQDTEAWYKMHPAERDLVRSAIIDLSDLAPWTKG